MKKTLIICTNYPLPDNTGTNMRTMNFVHFFKKHGTVDIAYSHSLFGKEVKKQIFSNKYFLKIKKHKNFKRRLISGFIKGIPVPINKFTRDSHQLLLSLIESNDYDYIFVRYVTNTSILFKLPKKYKRRTIVDFDDVLSDSIYESMYGSSNSMYKKIIKNLNKKLLIYYEKKCLDFGASIFCSEDDILKVTGNCNTPNTFVVPNVYDNYSFKDYDFGDGFINGNNLLFVGTLSYKPNIDGLKWFIEVIFPNFKKEYPDAKLLVVGRLPIHEIKKLCETNNDIELYADALDIKEYYKRCKAVVVPLLSGGGTRIKILEAAMANRPVLSTPIGAKGLELVSNTDLLLFENAQEFSIQYSKLLNKDKYHSLINNARKVVSTKYSVKSFNNTMTKVLNEIEYRK